LEYILGQEHPVDSLIKSLTKPKHE
jgi:hypothetical protein